jgi:large subunit ribosomal protein L9
MLMKVILLQKIRNLGDLGDVVQVKSGFGRNYLIPQEKAVRATKENIAVFEARRTEFEKQAAEVLAAAEKRAEALKDLSVTIVRRAMEEGKLFGSVGVRDIVNAIAEKGIAVSKHEVNMPYGSIREIGESEVELQLHSDINVPVKVVVEAG